MRATAAFPVVLVLQSLASQAAEPEQQVVCEVSYLNHAWGFQHAGVYIDPKGSIGEFNYSAADSQWAPNRGQVMTQGDLREKYRPGHRIIGKVCPKQMIWLRDELNEVRYAASSNAGCSNPKLPPASMFACVKRAISSRITRPMAHRPSRTGSRLSFKTHAKTPISP
jgi:hypothetical protein